MVTPDIVSVLIPTIMHFSWVRKSILDTAHFSEGIELLTQLLLSMTIFISIFIASTPLGSEVSLGTGGKASIHGDWVVLARDKGVIPGGTNGLLA